MSKNPTNQWKSMKIANTNKEVLYIFWTTWGIWMKFPGKMYNDKSHKKQDLTLSLKNMLFEKPQGVV